MSNIGDDERLVVLLEARIRDFEQNMRKASGTAGREFRQMRQDARTATSQMESDMERSTRTMGQSLAAFTTRAGALARSFAPIAAGAAAGGAALAGFVATARNTAREIATIGDEARRAGLSVRAFQELKFVADQNRVSVDALTDGMKELSLRADEFIVTGSGSGGEAFRRLGFRADELKVKLRDPSALFTEIIGKLQQLDKAAQIRIADELFGGTGGEQFVQLIDQGAAGIQRMIRQANDLGIVMDEEMIAKAAEIDRQFGMIVTTVGTRLKGAIVDAADALRGFFDYWNETQDQQDRTLRDRLGAVFEERQALMDRIAEMQAQDADPLSIFKNTNELKIAQARLAELTAEAERLKQVLDERNGLPGLGQDVVELDAVVVPAGEALDAYGQSLVDLRARLQSNVDGLRLTADTFGQTAGAIAAARFEATAMAEALRAAVAAGKNEVDANTAKFIRERAAEYGALTDRVEANTEAERERQRVVAEGEAQRKRVMGLETDIAFERSIMFLPEREQQIRTTLRGVGVEFESFEGQRLAAGLRYNGALAEQQDALETQNQFIQNILSTSLDALFDVGKAESWGDAVLGIFADIGRQFQELAKQRLMETLFGQNYTSGPLAPGQRSTAQPGFPAGFGSVPVAANQNVPASAFIPTPTPAIRQTTQRLAEGVTTSVSRNLLSNMLSAGKSQSHISGLNQEFAVALTNMFSEAPAAVRSATNIYSGFRSVERQAELFRNAVSKYGSEQAARKWVAPPGNSQHNRGMAADLRYGNSAAREWIHANAGRYGLAFPLGHENWHIELAGARGSGARSAVQAVSAVQAGYPGMTAGNVPIPTPRPGMGPTASGSAGWFGQDGRLSQFMQSPAAQMGLQAIGAFGTGYSSGSAGGGAFSGGLSGLMTGGPVGAVIGGISGPIGGKFGKKEKRP